MAKQWLILYTKKKGFYPFKRSSWPTAKAPRTVQDIADTEEEARRMCEEYNRDKRRVDSEDFTNPDEFKPEPTEYRRRRCLRCDEVKQVQVLSPVCSPCAGLNRNALDIEAYGSHQTGGGDEE